MQVQHETQLIGGPSWRGEDFLAKEASLDVYALNQATLNSIEWLASCPTRNLVAVYLNGSHQIVIIDTKTYLKRERFPLKPCDKKFSKQSLALKGVEFSPDGQRLAVGQSDCIIYIYKLPNAQNQPITATTPSNNHQQQTDASNQQQQQQPPAKATITGKFVCSSPVTCLLWTEHGIVFGTQDGKIKLVSMGSKSSFSSGGGGETKVIAIYNSAKTNMPIAFAFKSPILVVSFINSNVIVINLSGGGIGDTSTTDQLNSIEANQAPRRSSSALLPVNSSFEHSCPAYHLSILQANTICCAGSNGRLSFYQLGSSGGQSKIEVNLVQAIDLKEDIVGLDYSLINEILAVATSSRLMFVRWDQEGLTWRLQNSFIELTPFAITSLKWLKCDGSQLVVGQLNGQLELFRCQWSKQSIGEQFDICHIAKNRVRIADRARNLLATYKSQYDIKRVNLLDKGQSVIIWTTHSILLARLACQWQQSEISWSRQERNEIKFCFDHAGFVLLYNATSSTLNLVRLGDHQVAYAIKLDSNPMGGFKKSLVSVRQYPPPSSSQMDSKWSPTNHRGSHSSAGTTRSRQASLGVPEVQIGPDSVSPVNSNQVDSIGTTTTPITTINERLALVLESNCLITVINLMNNLNQKELSLRHEHPVRWLDLSYSAKYLVFVDVQDNMHLIGLEGGEANHNKSLVVIEMNEFCKWLPETDILVAQSAHKIMIWYNLNEVKDVETHDSGTYNITEKPPLIDLSLLNERKSYPTVRSVGHNLDPMLILSNGQQLPLDKVKVRFYTEIVRGRLDCALEVLAAASSKSSPPANHQLELWLKLGWLAIEQDECQLAIGAFKRLNHRKMINYLEKCLAQPEEVGWRLAMLKGNWLQFERLCPSDQIISIYRRLNKWSQLIAYLERSQQFRQRDLAEQDYKQWLLSKGRHLEAAQIQASAGDKLGALELLMENNKLHEAVQLFVAEQKSPLKSMMTRARSSFASNDEKLLELAERLKRRLVEGGLAKEAALVCDRLLDSKEEALELYLGAQSYAEALELAKLIRPDRVAPIEGLMGEQLMEDYKRHRKSRRQALKASEHFVAAGKLDQALVAAVELGRFERAYELLELHGQQFNDTKVVGEQSLKVGDHFLVGRQLDYDKAIRAYLAGGHHEKALRLMLDQKRFKPAYELCLSKVFDNDGSRTRAYFVDLAEQMARDGRLSEAEQVWLEALGEAEGAIELHRRHAHDLGRMFELLEAHQPDQLEAELLRQAKELEQAGRLEEAEKYLMRVSQAEWTNVVRMYRLAGQWAEAFRVARAHCASSDDPLLVQLAFWWSKSLGDPGKAYELLQRDLGLLQQVLDFCCDNKSHQFALELLRCRPPGAEAEAKAAAAPDGPIRRVAVRYASHQEEQHQLGRAEEVLLEFGLVEEACRMYLDNDRWPEAVRVAEAYEAAGDKPHQDGQLLKRVLVECADRLVSEPAPKRAEAKSKGPNLKFADDEGRRAQELEQRLAQARQMYLRAQRPELAVALYRSRGMWQEAVQVAQRFAPQLLEGVERQLDEEVAQTIVQEEAAAAAASGGGRESRSVSRSSSTISSGQTVRSAEPNEGQSRVERYMRQGDLRGTRQALAQFLETLVDGPPGGGGGGGGQAAD